ncbi:MAG: hypothetical protein EOP66_10995 [Sphingomonas sp.]|nr:MAG: hypothetical protein EOP66_10995 [Sphingomonas sp.]
MHYVVPLVLETLQRHGGASTLIPGTSGTRLATWSFPCDAEGYVMHVKTMTDLQRLDALLSEALALADALDLPIAAIHIDQARSQLGEVSAV